MDSLLNVPPLPQSERHAGGQTATTPSRAAASAAITSSKPDELIYGQSRIPSAAPPFTSALQYTLVRDFAYPDSHRLHYGGQALKELQRMSETNILEGPPWHEDEDLRSPVRVEDSPREDPDADFNYEFSVTSPDEVHGKAVAMYDFVAEHENEMPLKQGQIVWISYRHGQGWLVAQDPQTGETGLVPEGYVQIEAR
ncbi:hypothetical protein CANCADRAFT_3201 [Tortispora caseinolytica NRRL Y-17796]|uniref:SH3 domain-containing protein n=1 Tax=Tortispora caseinolytica NRRL Y-17796 TaxID=767744 RepID=A0A1E4T9Y9_9ASCO|nr:hypothetical protein CANCADRAFT_3201 [Tortispora caseinolytica NRRL Y-17796]